MQLNYPLTSDLLTLFSQLSAALRVGLKGYGLTFVKFRALEFLRGSQPESLRAHDLARILEISPSSLTYTLTQLEKDKLVKRVEDDSNHRQVLVDILPKGVQCTKEAGATIAAVEADFVAPLGNFLRRHMLVGSDNVRQVFKGENNRGLTFSEIKTVRLADAVLFTGDFVTSLLKEHDLTLMEFRLLFELLDCHKGTYAKKLAGKLLLHYPEITENVNNLAARGLILRNRSQYDRRSVALELSSDGFGLISVVAPSIDERLCNCAPNSTRPTRELYLKASRLIVAHRRKAFRL